MPSRWSTAKPGNEYCKNIPAPRQAAEAVVGGWGQEGRTEVCFPGVCRGESRCWLRHVVTRGEECNKPSHLAHSEAVVCWWEGIPPGTVDPRVGQRSERDPAFNAGTVVAGLEVSCSSSKVRSSLSTCPLGVHLGMRGSSSKRKDHTSAHMTTTSLADVPVPIY